MEKELLRGYQIEIHRSASNSGGELKSKSISPEPQAIAPQDGDAGFSDTQGSDEALTIDGVTIPFEKTSQGYQIYYEPATQTLMEAAKSFVNTQPEKNQ